MKAKTLIQLLTLSSNFYLIAKDKDLLDRLSKLAEKGKEKVYDLMEDFSGESEEDERFILKVLSAAQQAKEELEKKMEELAITVYHKMHIAHTDEIKNLETQIEDVKKQVGMIEARLNTLESKNTTS